MEEKFIQKQIQLDPDKSSGRIKVGKLCNLVDNHPYKENIYNFFDIENIKDEYILIDYIDLIYEHIRYYINNFKRYSVYAKTKDIDVYEKESVVNGHTEKNIIFNFDEYVEVDEVKENLEATAIYNSKNSFLDEYFMTKYANNLFKIGQPELARYNVNHFRQLAKTHEEYNKLKSYRLVDYKDETFLRGITSTNYKEYGVDFAFVVSMLLLHSNMKENKGTEYTFTSVALNESKLEIIVTEKLLKDAGAFGKISTAIKVSTNDLGNASLNFSNIINVIGKSKQGFYLIPREKSKVDIGKLALTHITSPEMVFKKLKDIDTILNTSDDFISELKNVKSIKTPDELRVKIHSKIVNPKSSFRNIKKLADIFNRKIDNEISSFSKLLDMCNKAEELNIEYDLKDKLRYIISDIMLYGNTKS
jgi:hypothetical protein